ncbi:MAG: hemerythrin domain-containing protein [Anaerolineae bacterium]
MSQVTKAIRNHHRELVNTLAAQVAALVESRPDADPRAMATFLSDELLPHAIGEERHLYPVVEPLVKAHGRATTTMSVDHEFIEEYIRQIGQTVQALQSAVQDERPALETQLQRLALQLEAVLQVHLEKEERVYLPLFEQYLSEEEQQLVLDGMHAAYEEPATDPKIVDVRQVPPPQRHPLRMGTKLIPSYTQMLSFRPEHFNPILLAESERVKVLLVCLEPGQFIPVHRPGVDLALAVLEGQGQIVVENREEPIGPGAIAFAPAGEMRGLKAETRLIALHVVAPPPTEADHAKVMAGLQRGDWKPDE